MYISSMQYSMILKLKKKNQQYFGIQTRPSTQDTSTVQVPVALSSLLKNENIQT